MPVLLPGWSREEIYYIAERAHRLYRQGCLHQAAILFEGLLAIDPEDAYSHKALAAIHITFGRADLAVPHFSVILANHRLDVDTLAWRCEALIMSGDFAAAKRDMDSLSVLPAAADHVRRLKLQLPAGASQLLPGAPR